MKFAAVLLPEFDHEMKTRRSVLERLPEAKFDWKPHVKSMALGRLASHLVEIPGWAISVTAEGGFDVKPAGAPPYETQQFKRVADVLAKFDEHVRLAREGITSVPEADWESP
jgi:hypothetical protein